MKIPSKNLQVSDDLLQSVKLNTVAQAMVLSLKPTIEQIQRDLLTELQFTSRWADNERACLDQPDQIIREPEHLHHLKDDDSNVYFSRLHQEYINNGFDVQEIGNCPLLKAEWMLTQTENLIIDCAEYVTEITRDQLTNMSHRDRYIDVTIRMVFGLCKMESSKILKDLRLDPDELSKSIETLQKAKDQKPD